jgi:hypothetical protein
MILIFNIILIILSFLSLFCFFLSSLYPYPDSLFFLLSISEPVYMGSVNAYLHFSSEIARAASWLLFLSPNKSWMCLHFAVHSMRACAFRCILKIS